MAHLIHVWHERNGWSHKVLPALSECLELGKVHNSQISNLRNGKLASPGPEVFLALAQANHILYQGVDLIRDRLESEHPELLKVLLESAIPIVGDDKQPLSAGGLFEIFIGLTPLPSFFDWFIEEDEAEKISSALADHFCNRRPWRQCREKVMAGLRDYTAEELDGELLDLFATHQQISVSTFQSVDLFLESLRSRVSLSEESEQPSSL